MAATDVQAHPAPRLTTPATALTAAEAYAGAVRDGAADRDRRGELPRRELARLDRSGLLGITVPHEYGGPQLPPSILTEVIRRIAAADPSLAQVPQGHFLMVDVLALLGGQEQSQRWFGEVLSGARLATALAERGTHHAQDLQTRLHGSGDGPLRLTGRKYYCTGAATADWLAVSALDDAGQLALAVIPADSPGVTLLEDWDVMGQRATVSGSTIFEDVSVAPELLLPYWQAFARPQVLGARAQLVHAAIEVGIAGGALADAGDYLRERARPSSEAVRAGLGAAAEDPHVIHRFGQLATRLTAAEQLLQWAARTLDDIGLRPPDAEQAARGSLAVAQAKAFGSETAVQIASDLFALTGTSATASQHDLDRHWRNARTHSVHDPVAWKYHHIGNHALNAVLPPSHGQL